MLGKTHITLGIASALVITQPTTISEIIAASAGGALGGWVVDIDLRNRDIEEDDEDERGHVYSTIAAIFFLGAFFLLDFFVGNGMCQYVVENWGVITIGSFFAFLVLILIGLNSKHRSFTHSFLSLALFSGVMFLLCYPVAFPFLIGYGSHLVADFCNKKGVRLLFPLRWNPRLNICASNKTANTVLFWLALVVSAASGAFFFASAMVNGVYSFDLIYKIQSVQFFGLDVFQFYLLYINIFTLFVFLSSRDVVYQKSELTDRRARIENKFEMGLLFLLVIIGGGVGFFLFLFPNLLFSKRKKGIVENGKKWCLCYMSVLFWVTVWCYLYNPFGNVIMRIDWLSPLHWQTYVFLIGINSVTGLYLYTIGKREKLNRSQHTVVIILGTLGGAIAAVIMAVILAVRSKKNRFKYVTGGFFLMIIGQIIFTIYMMSIGVF